MTYGDLVHSIFGALIAGAEMSDEVPDYVLHSGELPRMEPDGYVERKGVGVSGQEKTETV